MDQRFLRSFSFTIATLVALAGMPCAVAAADQDRDVQNLKRQLDELLRRESERESELRRLRQRVEELETRSTPAGKDEKAQSDLDAALADMEAEKPVSAAPEPSLWSRPVGAANLRLIDVSLDTLLAGGSSTATDEELQMLQGGGHDPRKRGFTVQNVELSLIGAVDPYLTGEAHLIYFLEPLEGESRFELEEAFFTTQSLPYGLQLEGGHFFTEFGIINPQHPHAWHWQDQPVVNTRLFGPDGMRGPGVRLGWLTPLPWFSEVHLGFQNASGETMASFLANDEFFEERPIGGRPFVERDVKSLEDFAYLARWVNSWDPTDELTAKIGVSGLFGPNASGPDGETRIYGADVKVTWRPVRNFRGRPFVLWQSEVMKRDYDADAFFDEGDPDDPADDVVLPRQILRDWGLYTQVLYGFRQRWTAGLRYDYAEGSRPSVGGRSADPFRDDRQRISPILGWQPSEFSRFRLQYNYDQTDHLDGDDAHSVWVGAEFLYGAHPAHVY